MSWPRDFIDQVAGRPRVPNSQAGSFELSLNNGWTVDARILRIAKQCWLVQVRDRNCGMRKSRRSALRAAMRELGRKP